MRSCDKLKMNNCTKFIAKSILLIGIISLGGCYILNPNWRATDIYYNFYDEHAEEKYWHKLQSMGIRCDGFYYHEYLTYKADSLGRVFVGNKRDFDESKIEKEVAVAAIKFFKTGWFQYSNGFSADDMNYTNYHLNKYKTTFRGWYKIENEKLLYELRDKEGYCELGEVILNDKGTLILRSFEEEFQTCYFIPKRIVNHVIEYPFFYQGDSTSCFFNNLKPQ